MSAEIAKDFSSGACRSPADIFGSLHSFAANKIPWTNSGAPTTLAKHLSQPYILMTFLRSYLAFFTVAMASPGCAFASSGSVLAQTIPLCGINVYISGNTHIMPGLLFSMIGTTTPATNPPAAAPAAKVTTGSAPANAKAAAPSSPPKAPPPGATSPAASTPMASGLTLDGYIKDLTTELKLSDSEKQEIESYYIADGDKLKGILNNDALSPRQQAQQVADLRDARNAKIDELLDTLDRQHEFAQIEVRYRVALTMLAAEGGLVSAPAAPASATPGPASAPANPPPAAKT
jgi:hypothetical protein